ncbi:PIN domain nuclease (plasmid) [Sphingobium sp. JS3065]|uniref:type II toxin-antitoxin system VapC family toxin n=1 Tax=Sphingobium sp. JS3065 TaxID=2970925 RepID=UPI0022640F9F|nr:PIN domain nuclease [Sphingobium sp. JS3065]UZW57912.1 PIN domain nuclease [Sphingobium sp. JS3065]
MILVDSSVWIDFFRGRPSRETDILDELLGQEPLLIGDLVLAEVLQGFSADRDFKHAYRLLGSLELIEIGGREIALQAARNFRSLRARGITVRKTIDTLIATRCIEAGINLLHDDRDFDPFTEHLGLNAI